MNRKSLAGIRPEAQVLAARLQVKELHKLVYDNWRMGGNERQPSLQRALEQLRGLRRLHPELSRAWQLVAAAARLTPTNRYVRAARAHEQQECSDAAARPPQSRCWNDDLQRQFEQMAVEPPESFSDLLKERVQRNLMEQAEQVLGALRGRLRFWSKLKRFETVKPLKTLSDIPRVGKRIRRTYQDTRSLRIRNDLYGRVLELVASGKCPDPAAFAAAALKVEDIEFPRECRRSHDD